MLTHKPSNEHDSELIPSTGYPCHCFIVVSFADLTNKKQVGKKQQINVIIVRGKLSSLASRLGIEFQPDLKKVYDLKL
jgi:hypothetical protein